jgi:hypothetical protein
MNVVDRVKAMLLSPRTEWPRVAAEPMTAQDIYTKWVLILAAIGPIATIIGTGVTYGFGLSLRLGIVSYLVTLVMVAIVALVIDVIAPYFGGSKDFVAALKLAAFSYTAAFVAGVLHLLGGIGGILFFVAALYSWYLLYLGAPVLGKTTQDKAVPFTIAVAVVAILVGIVLSRLLVIGMPMPMVAP